MILRRIALAALGIALAAPVSGSAQYDLASLVALMNEHPTVAVATPSGGVSRYHVRVSTPESCTLGVAERDTMGTEIQHDDYSIALARLSPEVEVKKSPLSERWGVYMRSSTGEPAATIQRRTTRNGQPSSSDIPAHSFNFHYQDEEVANNVAGRFRRIIAGCGGRPLTPEARAAAAVEAGTDPETVRLKNECRNIVRRETADPDGASFDSPARDLVVRTDDEITFMGDFTTSAPGGSRRNGNFACSFVRSGTTWVPKGKPLIF